MANADSRQQERVTENLGLRPKNRQTNFTPGQITRNNKGVLGGGGPANAGAKRKVATRATERLIQPSWFYESVDENIGKNYPPDTPLLAGGTQEHPEFRNSFRLLGDRFGGRG